MVDTSFFWISYLLLWALVIVLTSAVGVLLWYHGHVLVAGGAGRFRQGPKVGKLLPYAFRNELRRLGDGIAGGVKKRVYVLVSPSCALCVKLMDGLREVNGNISAACDVLVLCRGQQAETEKFSAGVPSTVRVLSDQDGRCSSSAGVASFPFVIVTTADGAVLRKGMPTTKQQLEALVLENKSPSAKRNTVARAGV